MLDEFLNKEYTKEQREKYPNIILFFDYIKTLQNEVSKDFICEDREDTN